MVGKPVRAVGRRQGQAGCETLGRLYSHHLKKIAESYLPIKIKEPRTLPSVVNGAFALKTKRVQYRFIPAAGEGSSENPKYKPFEFFFQN